MRNKYEAILNNHNSACSGLKRNLCLSCYWTRLSIIGFNLFLAYIVHKPGILGTVFWPETSLQAGLFSVFIHVNVKTSRRIGLQAGLFSLFIHVNVKTSCRERLQLHVSNEVLISGEYKKDISLLQEGEEHFCKCTHLLAASLSSPQAKQWPNWESAYSWRPPSAPTLK